MVAGTSRRSIIANKKMHPKMHFFLFTSLVQQTVLTQLALEPLDTLFNRPPLREHHREIL